MTALLVLAGIAALASVAATAPTYGLNLSDCATTIGQPVDANYYRTAGCAEGELGWALVMNSEYLPGQKCGPLNRSLPVNADGPFRLDYPDAGGVKIAYDGRGYANPCGPGWFNFAGLYDAEWRPEGQAYPKPSRLAVRYDAGVELSGAYARALLGTSIAFGDRRVIVEVTLGIQPGWGDAHPHPGVIGSFGDWFGDGRIHYLLLDGEALGIPTLGVLKWGKLIERAQAEGWLPPLPKGGRVRSTYFGVEARDNATARLTMREYETLSIERLRRVLP